VTNAIQKIMLCSKEWYDVDSTYQSYAKTNQQLTEDTTGLLDNTEVNGAVNMLPTDIATQVLKGATITHNSDGSYSVIKSTADSQSGSAFSTAFTLKAGTYYWSASQHGHSAIGDNDCYCFIKGINGTVDWYRSTDFDVNHKWGVITLTQDSSIQFGINVGTGTSNFTFYPMITVPSYNGDYVPYAKSNKELTEIVTEQLALSVISGNSGNVFDISCNVAYGRALVITPYSIGCLAYWSGTYHYIPIAAHSAITVTASNESSTGLTLTFTGSTVNVTIMSLTNRNDFWSGTRVS
jgi:hypothetical protein